MKNKRILTIAAITVAFALLAAFGIFRSTDHVQAQDQLPPPQPDRISFGMVGITAGQTMRINVTNLVPPPTGDLPPSPIRVVLNFRNANGQLVRDRRGDVIRKVVDLERGDSTFLDMDFSEVPPPVGDRLQLRAVIVVQPPPTNDIPPPVNDRIVSTVEIINSANGRTQFVVSALPAVQRIQPPPTGD